MGKNLKSFKHVRDPNQALQAAFNNLEKFSCQNVSSLFDSTAGLTVHEGQLIPADRLPIEKTIDFIAAIFSSRSRQKLYHQKQQVQGVVLDAIDVIKRNYLFLEKLKTGTSADKQLASSILAAIKRYNSILDTPVPDDWVSRIAHFFYKRGGFTLSEELTTTRIDLPETPSLPSISEKNICLPFHANLIAPQGDPLLIQEADAIRMKANTLLKSHGIRFKNPAEAVASLKKAPIHATLDEASMTSKLCLTLQVLPGTVIKVQGSFIRNKPNHTLSTPIPDSFHLVFNSEQTGFPHPSQYNGWALSEALIPAYPLYPEQLPMVSSLYFRKKTIASTLSSEGSLLEPAKQLCILKRTSFDLECLELHKELSLAILKAHQLIPAPSAVSTIEEYFDHLKQHPEMFDYLSETYHTINTHFIKRPFNMLQKIWLGQENTELFSNNPFEISASALKILNIEKEETCKDIERAKQRSTTKLETLALAYIQILGDLLGTAANAIVLQHMSETLHCAPPLLNEFEQRVQAATYHQLQVFLTEIEQYTNPDIDFVRMKLKENLKKDISFFHDPLDDLLPSELELYYNSRYYLSRKS